MSTGEFDQVDEFPSLFRLHAYRAVSAVVSDDHNFDRGVETARAVARTVLAEQGPDGLAEVTVELSLKLAEAPRTHRGRAGNGRDRPRRGLVRVELRTRDSAGPVRSS